MKSPVWFVGIVMILMVSSVASAAEDDRDQIMSILNKPAEEVQKVFGVPDAKYYDQDGEHWLYVRVTRVRDGEKECPSFLIRDGKLAQVSHFSEEDMKKDVIIAKGFGDFKPPTEIAIKHFGVKDCNVKGLTNVEVQKVLGPPDYKTIKNGIEIWKYLKVPTDEKGEQLVTFTFSFVEGKCTATSND